MQRLVSRGTAVALLAAAVLAGAAQPANAARNPYFPNGAVNWCQGGQAPGYGGARYCLGKPYSDGSFYAQSWSLTSAGIFAPGVWHATASCSVRIGGSIQGGSPNGRPSCGGGPQFIDVR
ncbi:hypothetical protein LB823_06670 [Tsukamurella sp. M9C]|uniref:hypothetical protein n=1 Tax=unclassified Tsukamurella TaxID=2633480 RepID=UPI001CCBD02B|nr:hypothetical protein [Tsukamurella sp. M9C]MCA0155875.1 hypothetical protein [Tsukamurella sp. M9C]